MTSAPLSAVRAALETVIRGKSEVIDLVLVAVLARGHILLEDVPGVGKTTLAKALSRVFDVELSRVQFTPDLLPTDILGTQVLSPGDGSFSFARDRSSRRSFWPTRSTELRRGPSRRCSRR